ncbi:hypothetical protein [Stenomitos frigidus]|uniref:AAA ATPase AAA+ lid domain-containing protein n=1 Tax=Stenomitos frigidus ULC18 TaxID=2107698 RepID=A0A2T1EDQ7_9CYAN|nr:hypothetical protein [Stenomitos frigidus]PSB30854.1 hypothetical protein C7B82_07955 [Stenomitos frigidus ULC18]
MKNGWGLDLQLTVDLPDRHRRLAILKVYNDDRPSVSVDLTSWAAQTEGWNGADLALLSNQAALEAVQRYRAADCTDQSTIQIFTDDFLAAYQLLSKQRQSV